MVAIVVAHLVVVLVACLVVTGLYCLARAEENRKYVDEITLISNRFGWAAILSCGTALLIIIGSILIAVFTIMGN